MSRKSFATRSSSPVHDKIIHDRPTGFAVECRYEDQVMNKYSHIVGCTAWLLVCGLLLILVTPRPAVAWQASTARVSKSVKQKQKDTKPRAGAFEEELFKDLDELPAAPASKSRQQQKPGEAERGPAIDARRQRRLAQGEDLGEQASDSWSRIGDSMRNVEGRIAAGNLGKETQQLQKMIVQDLGKLTKQLRQQSSDSLFSPGTGAASSPSSQAADDRQDTTKPATDSTSRIGQDTGAEAEVKEVELVIDQLWGHLPARLQTQLRGAAVDQFLPKYQRLLEQFYRRLAEEEGRDR